MDEQLQNNNSFQSNSLFGRRFLRILGWALVGAADAIGGFIGASICTCSLAADIAAGVGLGGAASAAGFFIFRGRGWEP